MSKFFIGRPIVAIVIAILMLIGGVVSVLSLPTAQFPDIVPPEILVQATYPGADAKTLEESVTTPIEQQVNGVDNMNYMYSTSANNGLAQLTVDFDVKTLPRQRPDTDTTSRIPSAEPVTYPGSARRRHGTEGTLFPTDAAYAVFPEGHLRLDLPGKLRLHQSCRPVESRQGRVPGADLRSRAVCLAYLVEAGSDGEARCHGDADHQCSVNPEQRQSGWANQR